jgi:hypothetical protein
MTAEEILETVRQAGGELWAVGDKLRYRLPAGAPDIVSAMRELKPEILRLLRSQADDPEAWREAFHVWRIQQCVSEDRSFGGIGCLHIHFCEWTVENSAVAPCTRATFEGLLSEAGFLYADGMVSGLILAEDWHAAHWKPERRKPTVVSQNTKPAHAICNPTRSPNLAPYAHASAPVREMSVKGEPNRAG